MKANKSTIITEDGQRLTVNEGLITGTEDAGPGLAYETGNVLDERNEGDSEKAKSTCPAPAKNDDNSDETGDPT